MSASDLGLIRPPSAVTARRPAGSMRWLVGYATLGLIAGALALLTIRSAPQPTAIAFAVVLFGAVCIVARPTVGVYLTVFLTVVGDAQLAWWYPFIKNLSSPESVLYVHDAFIVSPLELYLVLTAVVWLLGRLDVNRPPFERGALLWPVMAFAGLAAVGFAVGVGTGGDLNVALWEVRPIAYVPLLYVLATNLFTSRRQYRMLLAVAVAAIALESIHALYVIFTASGPEADRLAGLGYLEHSASLHANTLIVWLAAMAAVGERAFGTKLALATVAIPVGIAYLYAERRSAVVALLAALLLVAIVLHRHRRAAFWVIVPLASLLLGLYLVAFWNVDGPIGLPAQAIKSTIAPSQLTPADMSSDFYRRVETHNLIETIRLNPVLGQGFGHRFIQFLPLPYIPFVWADYLPHNSVLWIWMNMGAAGFVAMLYLFGAAIGTGARATMQLRSRDGAALALTGTLFIVMYAIYAYVDIAWDIGSMVLLGIILALIGNVDRLDDPAPDTDLRAPAPSPSTDADTSSGPIAVAFGPAHSGRRAS
jgi:O-antigen ligase